MSKKVLVIHQGYALIVNTLTNMLKEAKVTVKCVAPDINQIRAEGSDANVLLLFAEGFIAEKPEIAVYLRDISLDQNKHLCVLGTDFDIAEVKKIISAKLISLEYVRPFNTKTVSEDVITLMYSGEPQWEEKQVLLVDDDTMFLQTMQRWLSDKYKVSATKSGMQAITYLATHKPDLILLDYDMPVTTGPQVLEMIRSEPTTANIPVIFLTGRNDRESVMKVVTLKPDGYLLKSQSKTSILNSIDNFFETKQWELF